MNSLKVILSSKTSSKSNARRQRLEAAGLRSSKKYVDNLQEQLDKLEEQIEDMLDMHPETDHNAGIVGVTNEVMGSTITELHKVYAKLFLKKNELRVAEELDKKLRGEKTKA